jgi:hypothetical protein
MEIYLLVRYRLWDYPQIIPNYVCTGLIHTYGQNMVYGVHNHSSILIPFAVNPKKTFSGFLKCQKSSWVIFILNKETAGLGVYGGSTQQPAFLQHRSDENPGFPKWM